jgi:thymidine kinase
MPATYDGIELITGCMFSGKTSALFQRLANAERAGREVRLFKHVVDTRDGNGWLATHDGRRRPAEAIGTGEFVRAATGAALVAVDEGHFFDRAFLGGCRELAERGARVVVAAFELTTRMQELAGNVMLLRARCARCGGVATHSQRLTPIVGGSLVGGAESYEPRCERCFRPPSDTPLSDAAGSVESGAGRAC